MAQQNFANQEEVLLDVRVAEASKLYKFYLNQEKKILGGISVVLFLGIWELVGNVLRLINPMFMSAPSLIFKAAVGLVRLGRNLERSVGQRSRVFLGISAVRHLRHSLGNCHRLVQKSGLSVRPIHQCHECHARRRPTSAGHHSVRNRRAIEGRYHCPRRGLPIMINTRDGVKTTPANLLTAARSFGASEWEIFKSVVLPSTLPFILTGLRIASGIALVGVMVGELYAATAGIGFMITVAGATFQTDKVFVGVLIFAVAGLIGTELIGKIEKHFERWRPQVGAS